MRQNSGRRSTGSDITFCMLLNGLDESTVLKHHCISKDAAAPCGALGCKAFPVSRINGEPF